MARAKLSGRQIMQLFYTEVDRSLSPSAAEKDPDLSTVFRCKCGKMRSQKLKHGYTNLVQHVLMKHSDWVTAALREAFPSPIPTLSSTIKSPRLKKLRLAKVEAETKVLCSGDGIPGNLTGSEKDEIAASQLTVKAQEPTAPLKVQKRSQYLSWDDYFMSVAFFECNALESIVNPERKIVGIGYNGFPNGCADDELPWARESETSSLLDTKYPYVCHAEMNAILNKNSTDVKGCTIYVALFPCNECAKLIIQSGIARVVYCSDKYKQDWKFVASRRLLDMAGVQCVQHQLQRSNVMIDFTSV